MIHDRSYMQEPSWRNRGVPVTVVLILINAAVYLIEGTATYWTTDPASGQSAVGSFVGKYLALGPAGIGHGFLWQLVTYQFLHQGILHLAFNMLSIWIFGRHLEDLMGPRQLLKLYLGGGIIGGLLQIALSAAAPMHFGSQVVGASAATFALTAAFALIEPHRTITVHLFLVFPVTFRAIFLLWIALFFSIAGVLIPSGGVAHGAHLGGLLFGMAFVKWIWTSEFSFTAWFKRFKGEPKTSGRSAQPAGSRVSRTTASASVPEATPDYISREVDPILDKISAHGIQSLTDREKKILEAARAKMAKK